MEYYGITFTNGSKIAHAKEGWEKPGHKWIKRTKGKNGKWQYTYKDDNLKGLKNLKDDDTYEIESYSHNPDLMSVSARNKNGLAINCQINKNGDVSYYIEASGINKRVSDKEARMLLNDNVYNELNREIHKTQKRTLSGQTYNN